MARWSGWSAQLARLSTHGVQLHVRLRGTYLDNPVVETTAVITAVYTVTNHHHLMQVVAVIAVTNACAEVAANAKDACMHACRQAGRVTHVDNVLHIYADGLIHLLHQHHTRLSPACGTQRIGCMHACLMLTSLETLEVIWDVQKHLCDSAMPHAVSAISTAVHHPLLLSPSAAQ